MKPTRPTGNYRLRLVLAVVVSIGVSIVVIGKSLPHLEPGGLIAGSEGLVVYCVLGWFVLRGSLWAKWVLFALMVGTALAGILLVGSDRASTLKDWLIVGGMSVGYASLAVLVALPARQLAS